MAPPELETIDTDVAVIGSGGAGLMCVLHAATADPDLDITVISKGAVGRSGCTRMVQGGYNAVLDPSDSIELHFADTLEGGRYLNDQELAWTLVTDAPRVSSSWMTRGASVTSVQASSWSLRYLPPSSVSAKCSSIESDGSSTAL